MPAPVETPPEFTKFADLPEAEINEMISGGLAAGDARDQAGLPADTGIGLKPVQEVAGDRTQGNQGLADDIVKGTAAADKAKPDEKGQQQAAEQGFTQDDQGKWHRPDGTFASPEESEAASAALAEADSAPASGAAATEIKPVTDYQPVKTAVTEFAVKASDGTPVDQFPELTFSFKAAGKEHRDVPLDRMVRLAQSGVYNEQLQQEVHETRTHRAQTEEQIRGLQAELERLTGFYDQVMTNDQFLLAARQQYAVQNSPEARMQRLQIEQQQREIQHQQQLDFTATESFVANQISPLIDRIQQANPSITPQEMLGQLGILTAPVARLTNMSGQQRAWEMRRLVEQELIPWAEHTHQSRTNAQIATTQAQEAKTRRVVTAAQIEAARAKRELARATAPASSVGAGIPNNRDQERYKNPDGEWRSADAWAEAELGIPQRRAAR